MMITEFMNLFRPDGVVMAMAALPLIGAGLSIASGIGNAIFGGISARRQRDKQLEAIEQAKRENRNWYNRRYNEDATQRADAQRMLSRANEAIARRNRAAAGKRAVVGGTDASLATTQRANAEAMGNAIADMTANAEARKDTIEAQYREREQQLDAEAEAVKAVAEASKRANTAAAATAAINTGAAIVAGSGDEPAEQGAAKTEAAAATRKKGAVAEPDTLPSPSQQDAGRGRAGVRQSTIPMHEVERKKGDATEPDTKPSIPQNGIAAATVPQITMPQHTVPPRKKGRATSPDAMPAKARNANSHDILPDYENRKDPWENAVRTIWG